MVIAFFFIDLRFLNLFKPIYRWEVAKGVYQKGWPLHMETDAGPVLPARSKVECCMKCRAIVGCTGVDYFPNTLQCHMYGILSNISLP